MITAKPVYLLQEAHLLPQSNLSTSRVAYLRTLFLCHEVLKGADDANECVPVQREYHQCSDCFDGRLPVQAFQ